MSSHQAVFSGAKGNALYLGRRIESRQFSPAISTEHQNLSIARPQNDALTACGHRKLDPSIQTSMKANLLSDCIRVVDATTVLPAQTLASHRHTLARNVSSRLRQSIVKFSELVIGPLAG